MIAYVLHGKRDLRSEERPMPVAAPDEVLLRVRRMGICGSDVHYFATGHCGAFVPRRPFVLGHELAGDVVEVGSAVSGVSTGTRVAVDPSRPCGGCEWCTAGRTNLCPHMRYLGSASTDPHVDGAFASFLAVPAKGCHPLPENVTYEDATMLEPLSVATHAVTRGGAMAGKRVLILGAGTMGQLLLLVVRAMGAGSVAMVDVRQQALDLAAAQGAEHVALADGAKETLSEAVPEGFEVCFEASGAPPALSLALELASRGGTIVQLGTLPEGVQLPAHLIMQKELQVTGSFRFADTFSTALDLIASGKVDVRPIISHTFAFGDLVEAFELATDDADAFKIQVES